MRDSHDTPIPAIEELAAHHQWVNWRWEQRNGKPTKPPIQPDKSYARSNDPKTWHSFDKCAAAYEKYGSIDGIGFVLKPPHFGVDLDNCRDPKTGAIEAWAQEVIDEIASYTEVSPSETGVKIIGTADPMPKLGAKKLVIEKIEGDKSKQIEIFNIDRYFCITREHLDGTPDTVEDGTEAFERLAYRVNGQVKVDTDGLPAALADLMEQDKEFADAWHNGTKLTGGKDTTASGLDFSLVIYLSSKLADEDIERALYAYPHGQIGNGTLKGRDADKRIQKLLKVVEQQRARRQRNQEKSSDKESTITQDDIALVFTGLYRDQLRYCHTSKSWYEWTGQLWRKDEVAKAYSWTRKTGRDLNFDGKASSCNGAEKFAQTDEAFAVTHALWDSDPYLLGTPAGTVDLRSGELRPANPEDYITRATGIVPQPGDCPLWMKFLKEATRDDDGLIEFLQRMAGYSLTGDTREHSLFFVYGPGGNGKSVFLNVLTAIMGDYATVASMDTFQASRSDRHPTDLAMLSGARLVTASETEEGRLWAESRIKQMTGGDPITARFMHKDFFTYQPQFKLVIVGNHKPALRNVDEAARRRFNIIPFIHKPPAPDKDLERKLKAEYPQILQWMIDGCIDWQAEGITQPKVVHEATAEYFEEQDIFGQWIAERCIINANISETSQRLFADWQEFAERNGIPGGTQTAFGNRMNKAGYLLKRTSTRRLRAGITTKHPHPKDGYEIDPADEMQKASKEARF